MRLIDADALRDKRKSAIINTHERYGCDVVEYIEIVNAPTIKTEPRWIRPKAKWLKNNRGYPDRMLSCSRCSFEYDSADYDHPKFEKKIFPYCPNCGAKMYLEDNDA